MHTKWKMRNENVHTTMKSVKERLKDWTRINKLHETMKKQKKKKKKEQKTQKIDI